VNRFKSSFVVLLALGYLQAPAAIAEERSPGRIEIRYVPPSNPAHKDVEQKLAEQKVLEQLQTLLSPLLLPRPLYLEVAGCNGEVNAHYENDVVTVCYEYMANVLAAANDRSRPAYLEKEHVVLAGILEVFLHEVAHALFDYLEIPILGREEDAADQTAAYFMLNLEPELTRHVVNGALYLFQKELGHAVRWPFTRIGTRMRVKDHSDTHGTPAQRFYNFLCLAHGANPSLINQEAGHLKLPAEREEFCTEEFEQLQLAFDKLIRPHIHAGLAAELKKRVRVGRAD
jgi:hypothetical protein